MSGPCRDLIVLDFSWGMAGGLATMVLSDFGARVIKVEPPGGDPFRRHPAWLMWNRGKEGVVLDLKSEAGWEQALALAQRADVLLEAFRPGVAGRLGIGHQALAAANPRLVYCSLSPFGQRGPLSRLKGYEGVVSAKTGRMMAFRGQPERDGPVFTAVPTATWGASQAAVQGILAALLVRETTGRGQWVQTSLLQGMMPYDLQSLIIHGLRARDPIKYAVDPQTDPKRVASLQYLPARCGDGRWIQFGNNNFRLFQSTMRAMGLWNIYRDERFKDAPDLTPEHRELLRDMIFDKLEERSLDEWMQAFIEDGDVAAEPFMTTMEGLRHPQFVHNGHLAIVDDPRTGPMDQVGLLVDLDQTPGALKGPAPDLGQHTRPVLAWAHSTPPPRPAEAETTRSAPRYPLEGVTVLEFATIIAAPYAAALLADLGARVIKVEPPEADLLRVLAGGLGTGTVKTTAGAESIQIDLKTEEGRAISRKLIAQSDIVLHNFRSGVPERLGIDYEAVQAIRPDAIYVTVAGYGASGPFYHRPAFHPLPGALLGGALRQAGAGIPPPPETPLTRAAAKEISRRLFRANESNPDFNTSMAIATGTLLALYERRRTGRGQAMLVTMPCANAYANADEAYNYAGRPDWRLPDAENHGTHALYRLYEAAGGWVFLACLFDHEWRAFCQTAGRVDLLADPRFQTRGDRTANDVQLIEELTQTFAQRSAAEWERLLTSADVACVQADAVAGMGEFFAEDGHVRENALVVAVDHARFGRYLRHAGLCHYSESEGRFGPAILAGEQTGPLLRELGYSETEIDRLYGDRVVFSEPVNPIP